jgi:hypothetical protein
VRETERQRDRETERQRDRETERQRDRETERQRDRETERQRDRETEKQVDREAERQRDREKEKKREREIRLKKEIKKNESAKMDGRPFINNLSIIEKDRRKKCDNLRHQNKNKIIGINVWHKFDLLSTPQSRLRNLRVS